MVRRRGIRWSLRAAILTGVAACSVSGGTGPMPTDRSFAGPFPVTITGWAGDAMEPFLTRDGQQLVFNTRNDPADSTDLHIATRVDDSTFQYVGPLAALNSATLDAVPTGSSDGTLYFVSLRAYAGTAGTIFSAPLTGTTAGTPAPVTSVTTGGGGLLDFDVDVAPDGQSLLVARGRFTGSAVPAEADLVRYERRGASFTQSPTGAARLAAINTAALEYAPAITSDGLELCFTRWVVGREPVLMISRRATADAAWGVPQRIAGPTGVVEAGAWSPDARTLYFHALVGRRYVLRRIVR